MLVEVSVQLSDKSSEICLVFRGKPKNRPILQGPDRLIFQAGVETASLTLVYYPQVRDVCQVSSKLYVSFPQWIDRALAAQLPPVREAIETQANSELFGNS